MPKILYSMLYLLMGLILLTACSVGNDDSKLITSANDLTNITTDEPFNRIYILNHEDNNSPLLLGCDVTLGFNDEITSKLETCKPVLEVDSFLGSFSHNLAISNDHKFMYITQFDTTPSGNDSYVQQCLIDEYGYLIPGKCTTADFSYQAWFRHIGNNYYIQQIVFVKEANNQSGAYLMLADRRSIQSEDGWNGYARDSYIARCPVNDNGIDFDNCTFPTFHMGNISGLAATFMPQEALCPAAYFFQTNPSFAYSIDLDNEMVLKSNGILSTTLQDYKFDYVYAKFPPFNNPEGYVYLAAKYGFSKADVLYSALTCNIFTGNCTPMQLPDNTDRQYLGLELDQRDSTLFYDEPRAFILYKDKEPGQNDEINSYFNICNIELPSHKMYNCVLQKMDNAYGSPVAMTSLAVIKRKTPDKPTKQMYNHLFFIFNSYPFEITNGKNKPALAECILGRDGLVKVKCVSSVIDRDIIGKNPSWLMMGPMESPDINTRYLYIVDNVYGISSCKVDYESGLIPASCDLLKPRKPTQDIPLELIFYSTKLAGTKDRVYKAVILMKYIDEMLEDQRYLLVCSVKSGTINFDDAACRKISNGSTYAIQALSADAEDNYILAYDKEKGYPVYTNDADQFQFKRLYGPNLWPAQSNPQSNKTTYDSLISSKFFSLTDQLYNVPFEVRMCDDANCKSVLEVAKFYFVVGLQAVSTNFETPKLITALHLPNSQSVIEKNTIAISDYNGGNYHVLDFNRYKGISAIYVAPFSYSLNGYP